MATIAISCPKCEKQIKAPADLAGKKIRCKECHHVFVVKAPAGAGKPAGKSGKAAADKGGKATKETKPAATKADPDDQDANPYGVTETSLLPRCPFCAKELESEEQVICLNCGYNRRTRERHAQKKIYETSGGETFIWLLPGILCALATLILLGCIVVFWTVFPGIESNNKEEWWSVFFALWAKIWGSVICLFIGFFTTKFAIKRLILHPTAPEVEKHK